MEGTTQEFCVKMKTSSRLVESGYLFWGVCAPDLTESVCCLLLL